MFRSCGKWNSKEASNSFLTPYRKTDSTFYPINNLDVLNALDMFSFAFS